MEIIELFTGSYGFDIVIETGLDLSAATNVVLKIKNPRGVVVQHNIDPADFVAPLATAKIAYGVGPADFGQPGSYSLQVFDLTGGNKKLAGPITKIKVKPSVEYIEP